MPTPSIQTLVTDAQQILNLDSISAVRSVVAVALANANTGTPLNPNLTTQQLWNEFYQVVNKPKSDIESIIANQLMKFLFAPPAPGGAGADQQVIFNDGGVLAGDPQFLWNKTTNLLTVTGSATITGDLTVDTSTLKVDSANNRVGIVKTTPAYPLDVGGRISYSGAIGEGADTTVSSIGTSLLFGNAANWSECQFFAGGNLQHRMQSAGVFTWLDGAGGTRMTLNSTGLGVGVSPSYKLDVSGDLAVNGNENYVYLFSNYNVGSNARVRFRAVGAGGGSGYGGDFRISTRATNNAWNTDVLVVDSSGNLLVGTTSSLPSFANGRIEALAAASSYGMVIDATDTSASGIGIRGNTSTVAESYFNASAGTTVGSIVINAGGVSFNNTSDYRIKKDVQPLTGGLARVNALKPSVYKFKHDDSTGEGFLAHELAEVVPTAVTGEKDAVNEDGSIKPQGVDLSKVVPILVAAIKELTARVEALEA